MADDLLTPQERQDLSLIPWGGEGPDPLGAHKLPGPGRAQLERMRDTLLIEARRRVPSARLEQLRVTPDGRVRVLQPDPKQRPRRPLGETPDGRTIYEDETRDRKPRYVAVFTPARRVNPTPAVAVPGHATPARRPREHRRSSGSATRRGPPDDPDPLAHRERSRPELLIRLPLEGAGQIMFVADSSEDELRLRQWLRRSQTLATLAAILWRLLDDLDAVDGEVAA